MRWVVVVCRLTVSTLIYGRYTVATNPLCTPPPPHCTTNAPHWGRDARRHRARLLSRDANPAGTSPLLVGSNSFGTVARRHRDQPGQRQQQQLSIECGILCNPPPNRSSSSGQPAHTTLLLRQSGN
uniref:Putative secreted peptide n=1 Tax=Anopheles braziliensis TaxID=58242 RepID=A0A2M3ZVR1_9DIPT